MSRQAANPLDRIERLIVDGSNLLHAIAVGPAPAPAATLIGRIRAVIPASVRIELLFDGPPEQGMAGTRVASGVSVRHSGRASADSLALRLVTEATGGRPDPNRPSPALLVVTDDGHLARELRHRGAATIGTSWLVRRLARPRLSAPSSGRPKPPEADARATGASDDGDADDRPGWRPGRGATTKTGNPMRAPRGSGPQRGGGPAHRAGPGPARGSSRRPR